MARSKGRSGGNRSKGGGAPARKSTSRSQSAAAVVDEIEVVEEEGGLGIDDGIVIMTFLLLLAGFLCIDYARGQSHGEGILFKGKYEAPEGFVEAQ